MSGKRGAWPEVEVVAEWLKTMTYEEIGERVGVHKYGVYKWLRNHGLVGKAKRASSVHHVRVADEFKGAETLRVPMAPIQSDAPLSYWVQRGHWMLGGPDPVDA